MTPVKAIREKCLDCCGGSPQEVRLCPAQGCALHPFRMGKNPNIRREYTDAQRQEMAARLTRSRRPAPQPDRSTLAGTPRDCQETAHSGGGG